MIYTSLRCRHTYTQSTSVSQGCNICVFLADNQHTYLGLLGRYSYLGSRVRPEPIHDIYLGHLRPWCLRSVHTSLQFYQIDGSAPAHRVAVTHTPNTQLYRFLLVNLQLSQVAMHIPQQVDAPGAWVLVTLVIMPLRLNPPDGCSLAIMSTPCPGRLLGGP